MAKGRPTKVDVARKKRLQDYALAIDECYEREIEARLLRQMNARGIDKVDAAIARRLLADSANSVRWMYADDSTIEWHLAHMSDFGRWTVKVAPKNDKDLVSIQDGVILNRLNDYKRVYIPPSTEPPTDWPSGEFARRMQQILIEYADVAE